MAIWNVVINVESTVN